MDRKKYERMKRAKESYYESRGSEYLNNASTVQREDSSDLPSHTHDDRYFTKDQQNNTQLIVDQNIQGLDSRLDTAESDIDTLQADMSGKAPVVHTHPDATTSASGFMSAADKTKLNQAITSAPVTSVNTKTGAVNLTAADVGAATSGHTHGLATPLASGFMPMEDKAKLDGVGLTFIQAVSNAVQNLTANSTTKMNFATLQVDKKGGEFANSTFTPSSDGYYLVSSLIEFTGLTAAGRFFLYMYRNGAESKLLGTAGVDAGVSVAVGGTALIWLAAGNTLDIRLYTSAACSTRARGANYDYVHVVRLF